MTKRLSDYTEEIEEGILSLSKPELKEKEELAKRILHAVWIEKKRRGIMNWK